MILGTSFGIEISQDKIKHKLEKCREGELTRLQVVILNLYAITYDGSSMILSSQVDRLKFFQKYPDMVFGDNDGINYHLKNKY